MSRGFFAAVPSAPRDLRVTQRDDDVMLSWDSPDSDGGCPLTQYVVVCREESKQKFKKIAKTGGDVTSLSITDNLKKGVQFLLFLQYLFHMNIVRIIIHLLTNRVFAFRRSRVFRSSLC